ncbi:MAG: SH3 domain-containing protein [Peptostreptococcaceae bacterium]
MTKKNVIISMAITSSVLGMSAIEANASSTGIVNTSALNVRSGAGTNHSIIGKLYKGDKIDLLDSSSGWYKVKLSNGKTGWASSQYIDKVNNSGNDNSSSNDTKKGTVNTSALNVRSGASTTHSIIGKLYKGDKVDVLNSSSGWYKVKLSNGKTGWCSSEYITIGSSSNDNSNNNNNNNNETPESIKSGTVNTSTLNVRSGAGTSYSIIDKVHKGDKVDVLSSSSGWYKVKLSNGKTGWCSSEYITIGSTTNPSNPDVPPTEDSSDNLSKVDAVIELARKQIGKPYEWGATGPNSFDCSGLTSYVYKNGANYNLPRTSTEQSKVGTTVSKSNLKPGDLIFSSTNGTGNVSHVGIYIGNNEMIHAPKPGQNVHIVKINTSYWNNVYLHSKRIL